MAVGRYVPKLRVDPDADMPAIVFDKEPTLGQEGMRTAQRIGQVGELGL